MFTQLIGHERLAGVVQRMVDNETLAHAFLLVGPEGVGKTTFAQLLGRALLGHSGNLQMCPDWMVVERETDEKTGKVKSQVSIKQIRELTRRLAMSSLNGGAKVAFIEDAARMSIGASNALLKTLEEPKGHVTLLLRAESPDQLPATIVSRCQVLRFGPVRRELISAGLSELGFGGDEVAQASAMSLGCPGRAIRYLRDSAYAAWYDTGVSAVERLATSSLTQRLAEVQELIPKSEVNKRIRLGEIVTSTKLVYRDVLLRSLGCDELVTTPATVTASTATAQSVLDRAHRVGRSIHQNVNPHLALEHLFLN